MATPRVLSEGRMINKDRGYKKKIMIFSKASKKHQHSPRLDSALLSQCYRGLKEKGKGNNLLWGKWIHLLIYLPIQQLFIVPEKELLTMTDVVLPSPSILWLERKTIRETIVHYVMKSRVLWQQREGTRSQILWGWQAGSRDAEA